MPKSLYDRSLDTIEPRPEPEDKDFECEDCGEMVPEEDLHSCSLCEKDDICSGCYRDHENCAFKQVEI